jgi:hypothetical protein
MADPRILTPEQLQAIAEREKKATPGPWAVGQDEERASRPEFVHDTRGHVLFDGDEAEHDDLQFAAHARTDIPALLELVREQARELAILRPLVQAAVDYCEDTGECLWCTLAESVGIKEHEEECPVREYIEARAALAGGEEG